MKKDTGELIKLLRSSKPHDFDAAFNELRVDLENTKASIFSASKREANIRAKGALIELLGESGDPVYVPYIAEQLKSEHAEVVFWAIAALQKISTPESLALAYKIDVRKLLAEVCLRQHEGATHESEDGQPINGASRSIDP